MTNNQPPRSLLQRYDNDGPLLSMVRGITGVSSRELAQIMGMSVQGMSGLATGRRRMSRRSAKRLIKFLNYTLDGVESFDPKWYAEVVMFTGETLIEQLEEK